MEFTLTQDFPAGMDRLWAAFGRADYVRRKYRALGATTVRIRHFRVTAQAIDIELERDVPVDPSRLPTWSRALVGTRQTLLHRSAWQRTGPTQATATLDVSPRGLPLHARGQATIVELGPELTRMRLTWRVESTLPLIGEMAERLLADQVLAALEADHAFTLRFLTGAASSRPHPRTSPSGGAG